MNQTHYFQQIHDHLFGEKINQELDTLDPQKKKELAKNLINEGEVKLSKNDFSSLKLFHLASQLDPTDPKIWHKQGLAFFKYGSENNQEKFLLVSSKNFKMASQLSAQDFDIWFTWGKVLFALGIMTEKFHYFQEAKEKYQRAISLSKNQTKNTLSQLYWDCGVLWMHIADHSGEAIDVRMAIQFLKTSLHHQIKISPQFLHDLGNAHFQMATLINDCRIYIQAIYFFKKAIQMDEKFSDGWLSLAQTYAQLYINTLNEDYFAKGNESFSKSSSLCSHRSDIWLEWSQLLGESGRLNKDPQKLRLSIEKCVKAYTLNQKDPLIIGQWVESLSLLGAYTNRLDLVLEAENKIIKATDLFSNIADLWHSYGICMEAFSIYYNDTDYNEYAAQKFQTGLSLDRTSAELWHALASCYAKIGKDREDEEALKRANKFYLRAINLKPSCPSLTFDYATCLLRLGELSDNQKMLEDALFHLETTLHVQKDAILQHPELLFQYAYCLDLLGSYHDDESYYSKAIEIFHHILLIDPEYPQIHFYLALGFSHLAELTLEKKHFDQASNFFHIAAKEDEENDTVFLEWGITLISQAQHYSDVSYYKEAEQKLSRCGQLGHQHAYYYLACLYSLTHQFEKSLLFLKKAEKADVLPPIDEFINDEWLEDLKSYPLFSHFIIHLENRQNQAED